MRIYCATSLIGTRLAILAGMIGILRAFGALFLNSKSSGFKSCEGQVDQQPAEEHARGTVLAIDDEQAILETMRPLLRAEGFNVLTAGSGAKGLDMLRYCQRDVRLVVLDFNMPRLNGMDTLSFLRKLNPHVKVIAVTGLDLNFLPEEFRRGVDRILTKPYTTTQLISNVNELLGFTPAPVTAKS